MRKLQDELRRKEALYTDLKRPNPSTTTSTSTASTTTSAGKTSDATSNAYTSQKGQNYDSSGSNNRADKVEEELKKLKLMMKK